VTGRYSNVSRGRSLAAAFQRTANQHKHRARQSGLRKPLRKLADGRGNNGLIGPGGT
jgi:hypothetical protein